MNYADKYDSTKSIMSAFHNLKKSVEENNVNQFKVWGFRVAEHIYNEKNDRKCTNKIRTIIS